MEEKNFKHMNVSGGLITKKGKKGETLLLMIQRSADDHWPNFWEFPRGKCDKGPNEQLKPCMQREVKEETGLDVIPIKFIDKFDYVAYADKRRSTQHNFLCRMKDPNQKIKLSKEHQDYKWIMSVGEAELLALPEMKKTISKVFSSEENLVNYPDNNFSSDNDVQESIIENYLNFIQ